MPRSPFGTQHHIEMVASPVLAVAKLAGVAARKLRSTPRESARGSSLRPGPETPLWNALAAAAAKHLRRRGDKVRLARILGISRQRLHLLLTAKTACPDAERTLMLQDWVEARRRGREPA